MEYTIEEEKPKNVFLPITVTITLHSNEELNAFTELLGKEVRPWFFEELYRELCKK